MYKYNIGVLPDIINYFYVANSRGTDVHSYNTRNRKIIIIIFTIVYDP